MDSQVVSDADKLPIAREDALLAKVLESGNIEVLERFIALRAAEEERHARLDFEAAFSAMQKELPAIKPDKQVKRRNGNRMYDYASLPYIKSIIDPIAQKHGFSYYWSQADSPDGTMRTIFHLCNCGHERQNYFQSAMLDPISSRDGDAVTNEVQAARGTESYQKRATFIDGFGLTILGEDNDAQTVAISPELSDALDKIRNADTLDKLMSAYQIAYERFKSDQNHLRLVVGEYTIAKKAMAGAK